MLISPALLLIRRRPVFSGLLSGYSGNPLGFMFVSHISLQLFSFYFRKVQSVRGNKWIMINVYDHLQAACFANVSISSLSGISFVWLGMKCNSISFSIGIVVLIFLRHLRLLHLYICICMASLLTAVGKKASR